MLRGDPAQHAREETRQRILDAARDLGYRPNALARSLRTRRTGEIGVIVPSLDHMGYAGVMHGIQVGAAEAGVLVLVVEATALGSGDSRSAERVYDRLVGDGLVDGLILAFETLPDHYLARLDERQTPVVLVNRLLPGDFGSVLVHDRQGTTMAVEHLIELGHRRIGFIGLDLSTDNARRRRQGYLDALEKAGIEHDDALEVGALPTFEAGHAAIRQLFEQAGSSPPTAIVSGSPMVTLGVRAELLDRGFSIPDDLSLVAFVNHPVLEHVTPPVTAIRLQNDELGRQAVKMLLAAIEGGSLGTLIIGAEPELLVRGSTAPPPDEG